MKQITNRGKKIKKKTTVKKTKKKKSLFGTSKLEEDFAREFLEKLNIDYVYQFEAADIGRFYDFYLPKHNLIIEVDGGYWHSDPRVVKEGKLSPMQKRNKRVDEYKNKWALMHGIPIMRIWEKDIRENPSMVLKELKDRLYMEDIKHEKLNKKNSRHVNKMRKLK